MIRLFSKTVLFIWILGVSSSCSGNTPMSFVTFYHEGQKLAQAHAEVADTDEKLMRGLMFRKTLAEGSGMLFIFPKDTFNPFWMKNTSLSLDLIFIDVQGKVVSLIENAQPFSEEFLYPKILYRYVLEVHGGWARKNGVKPGNQALIQTQ
jgi:uncharacterized membrane protein (UPF0127 family)